ncbi:hypothetical protein QN239_23225 [Mycolicibacterium sp. Y3]
MVSEKNSARTYSAVQRTGDGVVVMAIRELKSIIPPPRDPAKRNQLPIHLSTMSGISSQGARMTELRSAERARNR